MPKFRKKPVVIEAVLMSAGSPVPQWLQDALNEGTCGYGPEGMYIRTLEGVMTASPGDWIIQGVKGEIYACKPDIFRETYEPAEPPVVMAEMTPEQEEAFKREWEKPWLPAMSSPEPGPAVGDAFTERLEDIDADASPPGRPILPPGWSQDVMTGMITDDHGQAQGIPIDWTRPLTRKQTVSVLYAHVRDALEQIVDLYSDLEEQLQAEGEHTAAANAEVERLSKLVDGLGRTPT